jgi:CHAT domain-containing protein
VSLDSERRAAMRGQLEKLKREVFGSQYGLRIREVSAQEVAKTLPANGVLVEFQRFQSLDIDQPFGKRWGDEYYVALVLKPNGVINIVPIGPAKIIDAAVHKGLTAIAERYDDADKAWKKLSNLVLAPLLPYLKSSRQWFLSPDGELHRVPFAALPSPQKNDMPLAEAVELRLLTTGRDLIRLQESKSGSESSLVMANPSYDSRSPSSNPTSPDSTAPLAQRRSADIGSTQWRALPATEQEGKLVAQLLSARLLTGAAATTPALQRQKSPQVLHVATHGFFIADQDAKPIDPLNAVQERASQLWALRQEDPQLRSGIVLAGANQPDADPNDDGYLTAAEAVMLNLKGTELVVFSACSTGQGEIRSGEGVYGLQRSLAVAGARSTLLSLWKVDDTATAAFMESFYRRLKAGASRSNALAAVQAEFRNHSIPAWRDPYYWAAWQLVGDWRPIKGL